MWPGKNDIEWLEYFHKEQNKRIDSLETQLKDVK